MSDDSLPDLGPLDDYPVDKRSCQLLGPTALVVQALMGVFVILSLVYKRHRETPKRPWRIWLFDVSKQVVGQMFVHGVNVFVSDIVSHHTSANACVLYFLNILIDTTLGVALIYVILHVLTYLFAEKWNFKGFESGVYGNPPSFKFWGRQAAIYVLSLTTMKMLVVGLLILFPGIFKIGEWLLSWTWTGDGDALQVIFTMGLFPIIMNVLQFWLIDSIVKASAAASVSLDTDTPDAFNREDHEPLFRASLDDDDDDDHDYGRSDIENQRGARRSSNDSRPIPRGDKSYTAGSITPDEQKSGAASSSEQTLDAHSYPPSLSSSFTSDSSSTYSNKVPKPATNLMKKAKRRGPPAPLNIRSAHQPAVNSPQQSANVAPPRTPSPAVVPASRPAMVEPPVAQDEWAETWDEEDAWENRASEDTKGAPVNGAWENHPNVRVGS
ncbi:Vaculolar membrane protein-domain-containing protein [Crucibulum laeve]|uniref:Vaculolar membrane protein-domain-containing protein n=1 Tax=Crucibulum laeve TaxID=68775 RepID=A0A5C3MRA9_9AGAR|nr:Vaculolar membrane protein-domain-containing protein [Crucibulum laeve]